MCAGDSRLCRQPTAYIDCIGCFSLCALVFVGAPPVTCTSDKSECGRRCEGSRGMPVRDSDLTAARAPGGKGRETDRSLAPR